MVALQPSHLPEAAEILDILNKIEFEVLLILTVLLFACVRTHLYVYLCLKFLF